MYLWYWRYSFRKSVVAKLKYKFKIDVKLSDMKFLIVKTIRKSYTQRTKFKKQSRWSWSIW